MKSLKVIWNSMVSKNSIKKLRKTHKYDPKIMMTIKKV